MALISKVYCRKRTLQGLRVFAGRFQEQLITIADAAECGRGSTPMQRSEKGLLRGIRGPFGVGEMITAEDQR